MVDNFIYIYKERGGGGEKKKKKKEIEFKKNTHSTQIHKECVLRLRTHSEIGQQFVLYVTIFFN